MATQDDVNRLNTAVNDLTATAQSVVAEVQSLQAQGTLDLAPATSAVEAAVASLKSVLPQQ